MTLTSPCEPCIVYPTPFIITPNSIPQGVASPLAGQMVFRASLFSAFGAAKRYFATNADGSERKLSTADFYKVGIHGWCAWLVLAWMVALGVVCCIRNHMQVIQYTQTYSPTSVHMHTHKHTQTNKQTNTHRLVLLQVSLPHFQRAPLTFTNPKYKCKSFVKSPTLITFVRRLYILCRLYRLYTHTYIAMYTCIHTDALQCLLVHGHIHCSVQK